MSLIIEVYIYVGLLSGWWFSTKLSKSLEKHNVNNKTIHWVTATMFLLLWPLIVWRATNESAEEIAKELKYEEFKRKQQ